jgi:hypothetical protein
MNFKQLYEAVVGEHGDIYTVEELSTMSKWEVSAIRIKDIQRMLRQKGYYKMGIRGLIPDVEPRNEIEVKAKELFASTPKFEYWRVHSELTKWIQTDLPKKRKWEIYKEHSEKSMATPDQVALKVLTYSLIIFPEKFTSPTGERDYDREKEVKEELHKDLKSMFIGSHFALGFEKEVKEWGVTQFKVYKEYDLDKETDQAWGDIASEL